MICVTSYSIRNMNSMTILFLQGYTFEAEANGQTFMVKVPVGGVEEGQTFPVQIPIGSSMVAPSTRSSVPVGYWKVRSHYCFVLQFTSKLIHR